MINLYSGVPASPVAGAIYKFPNDGTIDGSGSYPIDNAETSYDLTYQTFAVTVTTPTYTFNTNIYSLTDLTSTANNSIFTTSTGVLQDFTNRIA